MNSEQLHELMFWRALADDLADALHRVQQGEYDADVETAKVAAVLARYRAARR